MAADKQIERLKMAFGAADRAWAGSAGLTAEGELACRAGCFGCCVGLFEISLPEAALVRAGVDRLSPVDREEVVRRSRRIAEETASAYPGDAVAGLLDPDRSEEGELAAYVFIDVTDRDIGGYVTELKKIVGKAESLRYRFEGKGFLVLQSC